MSSELLYQAIQKYEEEFSSSPEKAVQAPGRVNLIGEHVDYNDGFVMPFALPFRTIMVGGIVKGAGNISTIYSMNMDESAEFVVNSKLSKGSPDWSNYIKGTVYQYLQDLPEDFCFNAVVLSDVPIGSGLSSSASLEVATATLLEQLCNLSIDGVVKALRCQKAEHTFADTPCGIMDQYISAMGKKGNLLLLDCRKKTFTLVPFGHSDDDGPVILVTNSNVKHSLSGSEYPDRVRQCKDAVKLIKTRYPSVKALRDATMLQLNEVFRGRYQSAVPASGTTSLDYSKKKKPIKMDQAELAYRRAHHCITEDLRTLATVAALERGDYDIVGESMTASHRSLQFDFEVSCSELDQLVNTAITIPGVYGSRMTGGGFGGCTVTLVKREAVEVLIEKLKNVYPLCECYQAVPCDGAGVLNMTKSESLNTTTTRFGGSTLDGSDEQFWPSSSFSEDAYSYAIPITVAAIVSITGFVFLKGRNK